MLCEMQSVTLYTLYRHEVFRHPLCIAFKFLCCTGELRKLWHRARHILFSGDAFPQFLSPQKALELFDIRVASFASILLTSVEPKYLNLFT